MHLPSAFFPMDIVRATLIKMFHLSKSRFLRIFKNFYEQTQKYSTFDGRKNHLCIESLFTANSYKINLLMRGNKFHISMLLMFYFYYI